MERVLVCSVFGVDLRRTARSRRVSLARRENGRKGRFREKKEVREGKGKRTSAPFWIKRRPI